MEETKKMMNEEILEAVEEKPSIEMLEQQIDAIRANLNIEQTNNNLLIETIVRLTMKYVGVRQ